MCDVCVSDATIQCTANAETEPAAMHAAAAANAVQQQQHSEQLLCGLFKFDVLAFRHLPATAWLSPDRALGYTAVAVTSMVTGSRGAIVQCRLDRVGSLN